MSGNRGNGGTVGRRFGRDGMRVGWDLMAKGWSGIWFMTVVNGTSFIFVILHLLSQYASI